MPSPFPCSPVNCEWSCKKIQIEKKKKKENKIVGHLPLGKSGKFAKTIFYFLRADELSSCKIVVTGKPVNLGDGEGMQVPCKLVFTGIEKCIDILKRHLYTC